MVARSEALCKRSNGHIKSLAIVQSGTGLVLGLESHLADVLANIFYHHLIGCNGLHGKQTPLMDPAPAKSEFLLPELGGRKQL